MADAVVDPEDHAYEYGVVPPVALADALPLLPPLQLTFEVTLALATRGVGCVMVMDEVLVQPFASVTVTVYVPALALLSDAVVSPLDQAYPYGVVPPEAEAVAEPLFPPLQLTLLPKAMDEESTEG